eukprot:13718916-Ditylum_brightwellii.AAC.1
MPVSNTWHTHNLTTAAEISDYITLHYDMTNKVDHGQTKAADHTSLANCFLPNAIDASPFLFIEKQNSRGGKHVVKNPRLVNNAYIVCCQCWWHMKQWRKQK